MPTLTFPNSQGNMLRGQRRCTLRPTETDKLLPSIHTQSLDTDTKTQGQIKTYAHIS